MPGTEGKVCIESHEKIIPLPFLDVLSHSFMFFHLTINDLTNVECFDIEMRLFLPVFWSQHLMKLFIGRVWCDADV